MEFTLEFIQVFALNLLYASPVLLFLIGLICALGIIVAKIEGWSAFDGVYHAFINATTVGYGDFRPTKVSTKSLAIALAMTGIIFSGITVALAVYAANVGFSETYDRSPGVRQSND